MQSSTNIVNMSDSNMHALVNNDLYPSLVLKKDYVSDENLDSRDNIGKMKDKIRNLKKMENNFKKSIRRKTTIVNESRLDEKHIDLSSNPTFLLIIYVLLLSQTTLQK